MLETDGERSLILARQIEGNRYRDPATRHQKCLPLSIFQHMLHNHHNNLKNISRKTCHNRIILRHAIV